MPECNSGLFLDMSPCIVWAAMSERVQHATKIINPAGGIT